MRWVRADWSGFTHSSRPKKVIWASSWCAMGWLDLWLQGRSAGTNEFANRTRKTAAIGGRSETRANRSLGRQRGAIERACTNAIGFQFFCCRWKDSVTLGTCGLACRFFSGCEISRVDYAQQSGRDERIARERKNSAREHRHQHCDRKRANNRARDRACDGGAHYRRATIPKR